MDGLAAGMLLQSESMGEVRIVNLLAIVPKCHSGISNYYSVLPVKASIQGVASERCLVIQFLPSTPPSLPFAKIFMIRRNAFCILFGGATNLRSIHTHLCANMEVGKLSAPHSVL